MNTVIPEPIRTFSDSSRRDVPSAALHGTGALLDVEYSSFENRSGPGGVLFCVVYGTLACSSRVSFRRRKHT